jgi:hypothetical protein
VGLVLVLRFSVANAAHLFRLEVQRDTLMKQAFNIEHSHAQVEALRSSVETVSLMKDTNRALQSQMRQIDTGEIEVHFGVHWCTSCSEW